MYNETVKLLFVTEEVRTASAEKKYRSIFKNIAQYEERLGKDAGEMNREELIGAGERIFGVLSRSGMLLVRDLMTYVRWYRRTILGETEPVVPDLSDHAFGGERLRASMFLSPAHLSKYLNAVLKPDSDESMDVLTKTAVWLIYAGLFLQELPEIRRSDLDYTEMCVRYGGRTYPIYAEAVKTIKTCMDMDNIRVYSEFRGKPRCVRIGRSDGDLLFRGSQNVGGALNPETLRNQITLMKSRAVRTGASDMSPTADSIWYSGLFYKMYSAQIIGELYPDREDAARIQARTNGGSEKNREHNISETVCRIRADYDRWRRLF